jgi:POT family proton-dependent oligopeptide transporter
LTDHVACSRNPYPYNEAGVPGALGGGQQLGTALGDTFKFFSYFCTVIGAVIAGIPLPPAPTIFTDSYGTDEYLGKYKTIMVTSPIYIAGLILLVVTSAPMSIRSGAALGGLIASILLIGLGTGCLKACIAPLCGEQTLEHECTQKVLKTGETVIVDPKLTIQRTFMWY